MQRTPGLFPPVLLVIAVLLLIIPGCGGDDPEEVPPAAAATSTARPHPPRPEPESSPVLLVDIVERHTDDFAEPLADVARPVTPEPPFTVEDSRLLLDAELLDQLDAAVLVERDLTLGSSDTPLGRCGLLVRRIIRYDGQGRTGGRILYEAHPAPPAEINMPPGLAPGAERLEIDPAGGGLYTAALSVRLLGGGGILVVEQTAPDGPLTVTCDGRSFTVATGGEAVIHEAQRAVTLHRGALTAGMVEMDPAEGPVPDNPDEILLPAETYGPVAFASKILVHNHGTVSAVSSGGAGS